MTQRVVDVEQLTPEEQLDLIGELWNRLSKAPENVPLTEAQRAEIDRRSEELDQDARAGRPLGIPWDEVFRQVRARLCSVRCSALRRRRISRKPRSGTKLSAPAWGESFWTPPRMRCDGSSRRRRAMRSCIGIGDACYSGAFPTVSCTGSSTKRSW